MLQFMTTKGCLTIVRGERAGVDVLYIKKNVLQVHIAD